MALPSLQKKRPRVLDKWHKKLLAEKQWVEAKKIVRKRDGGKCRACKKPGNHVHHIVYRSHGGKDDPRNLVLVCEACHSLIHAKVWLVRFKESNPAATLKFERNTQWDERSETRGL